MAPKGKKGAKKGGDDWDEGLGETVDPIAQAEQEAKAAEAAQDADEDGAGGGGLMAALKKNKEKRKKKGKAVENDFVEGEDPTQANGDGEPEPVVDLSAKAPEEATMEDEDVFGAPQKGKKGGKGGKQQGAKGKPAAEPEPTEDGEDDEETGGRVKTKAEKEKERKEREKQRKKEQAAAKKKAAPQQKQEEPKAVEAAPEAAVPEPTGGKKKKLNPALAAIQKQQEELRRKQEEEAREAAEAKAREEAERQRTEEEERHLAEQKAAKKAKEKAKIEQQKREGTYKTEKQRKDEAQQKLRLQQMLESGAKVAGMSDATTQDGEETAKKSKKDDRKKRDPKKEAAERKAQQEREAEEARTKIEELKLREEQERLAAEEAEKARLAAEAKKAEDEDEDLDDWEAIAEKEESGTKDSWDADSDEEEMDGTVSKTAPNGKPVQAGAKGSKAQISNGKAADDSESESEDESSSEDEQQQSAAARQAALRRQQASDKRKAETEAARNAASANDLRSPICCILGHVDTGKTKLLDKIRQTNVQEGEAGGITQQIGATYFPVDALQKKTAVVNQDGAFEFKVPGLLVIDTPGHESFTNLRSRGSSLCNIAILVVDIMHGLEPQTLESMRLLRDRKTPFIVALNKIDRLYGWKPIANNGFRESLSLQNKGVQNEFRDRLEKTKLAFAEQGFNAELFYENKSMAKFVSLVPTSAHTGEGIPDMLKLLVTLTQERMTRQLMYLTEVECTVLEVKVIEGLGTTIDVVLSNGILHEGDTIVLCGTDGPITTQVRALLTPAEMKELRVKSQYVHNKVVKAALGVKITANGLDNAIAGSRLLVAKDKDDEDEIEELEEDVMGDLENLMSRISKSGRGVTVQASTLGSLEALLEFLKQSKIPVSNISIGPVHKRDVITASTMLEKAKEYAVMLCFDVKVDKDAHELADQMGVKIFTAEIIYHLFDDFTKHMKQLQEQKKEESKMLAVFPCVLRPVAVFNKKDPIVIGIDVVDGNLRLNTPVAAVKMNPVTNVKDIISLGRVYVLPYAPLCDLTVLTDVT